jgi:hypothetical protein
MLRAEDERLRRRLRDRLVLEALLPCIKGMPLVVADRAADAVAMAGVLERAGALGALVQAWADGDEARLQAAAERLEQSDDAALLHHLALLHGRFAGTVPGLERATEHDRRALVCWLRLWGERAYLTALAVQVGGTPALAEELVAELPALLLEPAVGALARGRREATTHARRAMALLRAAGDCAREAELAAGAVLEVEAVARARIESVSREVLEEARLVAEHMDPLRADPAEREQPFRHVLAYAAWAGLDAETMVWLLGQAHDYAWELYRVRRMEEVRTLLLPLSPCADELVAQVVREPRMVGYRALCAQYFTFMGETEPTTAASIAQLERAVAVCPTHRNARVILADFLLLDAGRRLAALPARGIFGGGAARQEALTELRAEVDRALSLWPSARVPIALSVALRELG